MLSAIPAPIKNILKLTGIIVGTLAGLYLLVRLFYFVAPFIVAFLIASVSEPLVGWLSKKRKVTISRPLAALIATILSVLLVALMLFLLGNIFISQARDMINELPKMIPDLQKNLTALVAEINERLSILPDQYIQWLEDVIAELGTILSSYTGNLALFVFDSASSIFGLFLFVVLAVLSTYFFSKDYQILRSELSDQLPDSWKKQVQIIRRDVLAALIGYLKATLIFMVVTFIQLIIGFSVMRVPYAFIFAAVIALFDALPALGTGLFLIPWAVYAFFTGDHQLAIGLIILNVVVVAVRQIISPKIFGEQFGIHPISTMVFMYVGLKLLGVTGLILGPVILLILKTVLGYYTKGRDFREIIFGKQ